MSRIFLYATHPTLVDHESQIFHNMGLDVYTAAWATSTRSNWNKEDIYLNPKHFYKGICSFISKSDQEILSKINMGMCGEENKEISDVLLSNFDILYVSQITPWLMCYAPQFLEAGKVVLFRTFGYPLDAWGRPSNYKDLYKYNKFYILPTHYKEIELGSFKNFSNVRLIMASICEELFDKYPRTVDSKYALSVLQTPASGEAYIRNSLSNIINIEFINRLVKFRSSDEYLYLYNNCYVYIDYVQSLLRYSVFEAIMYDKPILVMRTGDMYDFMFKTKLDSPVDCYHGGVKDNTRIKYFIDHPEMLDALTIAEKQWFNLRIEEMKLGWKKLFEEIL